MREYTHWGVELPHGLGLRWSDELGRPLSEAQARAHASTTEGAEVVRRTVGEWEPVLSDKVKVTLMTSDPDLGDPPRILVQIDTVEDTGHITVYLNDGDDPLFDGDPELDEGR